MPDPLTRSTQAAWDLVAQKYAPDVDADIAFLGGGGVNLEEAERRILGDLSSCSMAVHLQCSHGLDALSLLNMGVKEVIGLDISQSMLEQAGRKSLALGAPASWIQADVLEPPPDLVAVADLVYTGKGATGWIADIDRWARVVATILRPGGRFFIHEAHPLQWVWDREALSHVLAAGRGYFDDGFVANDSFPGEAVARYAPEGGDAPTAWEHQWTLGQIVTAIAEAGLRLSLLEEHSGLWWRQFPNIPTEEMTRLPHMFSLLASKP